MRLIDADALEAKLEEQRKLYIEMDMKGAEHLLVHDVLHHVWEAPTIDAVPMVRCRDCRWWIDGMQRCGITISATPYGHCHDGETLEEAERKDNE